MTWTHRERVLAALNHEEPDRVPIDFGSGIITSITLNAYENLKAHLGVTSETKVMSILESLAHPDEGILRQFEVDTRNIQPGVVDARNVQPGEYAGDRGRWIDKNSYTDIFDVTWRRTEDSADQHFLDMNGPFYEGKLTIDAIEAFEWPDPKDPGFTEGIRQRVEEIKRGGDYAICLCLMGAVIFRGCTMRGFEAYLKDFYKNPAALCRLMDKLCDFWVGTAEASIEAAGPENIDVVFLGEDLGTQDGCLIDPDTIYAKYVKPRHRRMVETVKSLTGAKVCFHCCGSAYHFIDHLIDIGVDVLNPVQVTARNMEPERLKAEFGDRICFWGGINTQRLLPFGTPGEVAAETRRIIETLGKGGGYVLSGVHNIQSQIPPTNIVAMFDAGRGHTYGQIHARV